MSFHVSEGGLEGLLPSPRGLHRRPRAMATSGVTSTISPNQQGYRLLAGTVRSTQHAEAAPYLQRPLGLPPLDRRIGRSDGGGECPRDNPLAAPINY